MSNSLTSPPHCPPPPLPDGGSAPYGSAPYLPRPQDAEVRAAYGNFLRGMRRDVVRPFLMGAAAAFGMSLGAPMPAPSHWPATRSLSSVTHAGYALWDLCTLGGRTLVLLGRAAGPRLTLRGSVAKA